MLVRLFVALGACFFVAACMPKGDGEVDALARQVYADFRDNPQAVSAKATPELKADLNLANITAVRQHIPGGQPVSARMTYWTYFYPSDGGASGTVQHLYRYDGRRALATTTLVRGVGEPWRVRSFHVQLATEDQLAVNRLTLVGKSPLHYTFLLSMILTPLVMIAAVVKLVRNGGRRRRYWWLLPALLGVGKLSMNWTTGALSFGPFYIQLLGVGAVTSVSGFDPWMLSTSVPLAAILILTGVIGRERRKPRTARAGS